MLARALHAFAKWAIARNAPGSYAGEDDKRWAYTIETEGSPYLTRVMFPRIFGWRAFIHNFHREDVDRHAHNHPWKQTYSIILSGSYTEERLDVELFKAWRRVVPDIAQEFFSTTRVVRWFNSITDADYHRVKKLHGDVWTLFITGPRVQSWGFFVDGVHVPWRKYLGKE